MGEKYTTEAISGYNSAPPVDDGTQSEANKVKWATHKDKLGDPLKDQIANIDSKLVAVADVGPDAKIADYTTLVGDHQKTIEVTAAAVTITLLAVASAPTGYTVRVKNNSGTTVDVTATGSETIDGTTTTITLADMETLVVQLNQAEDGYISLQQVTLTGGAGLASANLFTNVQTYTNASPLVFEGATADAFETTLAITDPTADRTLTVPDRTGTIAMAEDGIRSITGTIAASALTVGLDATELNFRSATLTDGASVSRPVLSALSLVIPSGATLGTVDAIQSRLILIAIDNAGTVELAIVNMVGGNNLDETTLISTTTIGAGADTDNVIYSTTGRSNVAFRVVGYAESTQTTAGTWDTAPSTLQGAGGNALTAMSSIGYGQTWQNVAGSRAIGTTYYNTTGKPITIMCSYNKSAASTRAVIKVNGLALAEARDDSSTNHPPLNSAIVPVNASYEFSQVVATATIAEWFELR